jgi:large subunit ribosomal protein L4
MENLVFFEKIETKKKAIGLIHRVYLTQLKNRRKHTASTKIRSEVRGGGRKPWRQKGTGNARAGSIRSPLFVGGGVIFGPRPHLVSKKINKKERRLAILAAFLLKKEQCIFIENSFLTEFSRMKTKTISNWLETLGIKKTEKVLFLLEKPNPFFWLACRNLKNIEISVVQCLNIEQLLHNQRLVLSKSSLEIIYSTYGKHYA